MQEFSCLPFYSLIGVVIGALSAAGPLQPTPPSNDGRGLDSEDGPLRRRRDHDDDMDRPSGDPDRF